MNELDSKGQSVDELIARYHALTIISNNQADIPLDGKGHAVGYIRVSTVMQAKDGSSMESQITAIKNHCIAKNLVLVKIYEEPAKSGADRERPELKIMIDSILPNMKVIVTGVDRVARDTRHLLEIKELIHSKKCSMYIIDRNIDTADPSSEWIVSMLAIMADESRKSQNKNISNVMQDMSRKGTLVSRPKYGWKVVHHEVIRNEQEQVIIEVIRKFLQDDPSVSLSEIARRLELMNVKIRKCARIYPASIKNIIENNHLRDTPKTEL